MSDKPRILIVEDDLDLSEMLHTYFSLQEYEVLTAAWGRDALRISREQPLNLIMLDIRLPDITGYDVCRELRAQRRTQDVPILFLTEIRDRGDKLQGLELGVVDYITKPFDIQELRLRVRNAIQRAQQTAPVNPVTELPEVEVLDERLSRLIYSPSAWALLLLAVKGLGMLREIHGFVAADEVMRAVTLIVKNALREQGGEEDVVCHLDAESIVVLTTKDAVDGLCSRVETRVRQSLNHFYSRPDPDSTDGDLLTLQTGVVDHQSAKFEDIDAVKSLLIERAAGGKQ